MTRLIAWLDRRHARITRRDNTKARAHHYGKGAITTKGTR